MEALPEMYECVYPAILSNFDPKLLKGMMHVRVSGFHLNSISPNVTSLESVLGFSINKTVSDPCRPSSLTWSSSSPPSPPSAGPCLRRLVQSPGVARPERGLVMRSLGTSRTTSVNSVLNTVSSDTPGDYKGAALEELRSLFRLYSYPADRRRGDLVQSRDFQYSVCPLIELRPLVLRLSEQEELLLVPGPQELCVLPPGAQDDGL